jgi:hypothetical protein
MDYRTGKSFKEIVDERVTQYKKDIKKRLEDEYPFPLFNDEHSKIRSQLTAAYDSNPKFNAIFHELYEQSIRKKEIRHIDLCEEYCRVNQLSYEDALGYFPTLFYLNEIDRWILDEKRILEEILEEKKVQLKERKDGEFTNTRRILATYFLFKAAGKEIRYGEDEGISKARVAEFVQFLTSKESNPKSIRDTQIYSRVKKLWSREDLMLTDDLTYIAQEFRDAGLHNISQEIEQIINHRESEEK